MEECFRDEGVALAELPLLKGLIGKWQRSYVRYLTERFTKLRIFM